MVTLMPELTVEVFNADYRVLSRVPWQEAIRLILRGSVYVIDVRQPAVHVRSPSLVIELPAAVALREYVYVPYRPDNRVTRVGVLQRDKHTCAYCGLRADTVDHVLPRSRGGGDTWFNLVAACRPCNGLKGDRTPGEAGMNLIRDAFEPKLRWASLAGTRVRVTRGVGGMGRSGPHPARLSPVHSPVG